MTTNTTPTFFWTKIQENVLFYKLQRTLFIISLLLLVACNNKPKLQLESIKTPTGWGYTIKHNDKIIIKQSIIPAVSNQKSFENEKDALKVGNLVLQKLKKQTSPTITKEDLILLAVKT